MHAAIQGQAVNAAIHDIPEAQDPTGHSVGGASVYQALSAHLRR